MKLFQVIQFKSVFVELFLIMSGYYFLRAAILSGVAALLLESWPVATARKIYRIGIEKAQILSELRAAIFVVLFDALAATLMIRFDLFKHTPGAAAYAFTFVLVFAWFEIWFYVTHRLMHTKRFFWIHAQHHMAKVTDPLTAISFSIAERAVLITGGIAVPAVLSHWIPMSFQAYAFYFLLNYALNVYGHMNVELLPPRWVKTRVGEFLNSTTYHALHHARFQGHFGLFTPYLDRALGTRFDDYLAVHDRAYLGVGMNRLGEKFIPEVNEA